jgi:hypothetical protein
MGAVSSISRSTTLSALHIAEIAVFIFGFFFLVGWIAEETTKSVRWKAYNRVFVLMAIVGVAGEWIADIAVFALSEHLQTISDKDVAKLKRDTQQLATAETAARRGIADANERTEAARLAQETLRSDNLKLQSKLKDVGNDIAHARAREQEADLRIAELKRETEVARQQIAEAKAHAAEANERTETERLARIKLQKTVAWRELSDEQTIEIAAKLKPFAGENVDVLAYGDEPDSLMLSMQIHKALGASWSLPKGADEKHATFIFRRKHWWSGWKMTAEGWVVSPGAGWNVKVFRVIEYDQSGSGIDVETLDNANSRDLAAAKALVSALQAANLEVYGPTPVRSNPHRDVQLMNGSGDPTAPIELTILFRPSPKLNEGQLLGSKTIR